LNQNEVEITDTVGQNGLGDIKKYKLFLFGAAVLIWESRILLDFKLVQRLQRGNLLVNAGRSKFNPPVQIPSRGTDGFTTPQTLGINIFPL